MALVIDNCLIPKGSGINKTYDKSCCSLNCTFTNETSSAISLDLIFCTFQNAQFTVISETYFYQGVQITTFPFVIPPNESIQTAVDYCAGTTGTTDTLMIYTEQNGGEVELYFFDFQAIDLTTSIDETSIDFGTVDVNSVNQFQITINNPTTCCYKYFFTTDCFDTIISTEQTQEMCFGDSEVITFTWTPTTAGSLNCNFSFSIPMGEELILPVTGNAINPPSGGGERVEQKNKVDQTTRVEACSPRSANNRCQTAQTMQSAIRTNARRFGKR